MTFFYFVVITHFYRVFTYSAQGGANYISQTAFLPNFLPDYLFYSSLFQFHPLQSFFFGQGANSIAKTDGGMAG